MTTNIKSRIEDKHFLPIRIVIESYHMQDPDEWTPPNVMLVAKVVDPHSNDVLLKLDWYYDFDDLLNDLNKRIKEI